MMVPLMRSMYGRHLCHVEETLLMEFLMRELRRGVVVAFVSGWVVVLGRSVSVSVRRWAYEEWWRTVPGWRSVKTWLALQTVIAVEMAMAIEMLRVVDVGLLVFWTSTLLSPS
jgi:hypothetical protein